MACFPRMASSRVEVPLIPGPQPSSFSGPALTLLSGFTQQTFSWPVHTDRWTSLGEDDQVAGQPEGYLRPLRRPGKTRPGDRVKPRPGRRVETRPEGRAGPGLTRRRIVGISLGRCLIMKQDGFDSEAGKAQLAWPAD